MKFSLFIILITFGINIFAQQPGNNDLNTHQSKETSPEEMSLLDKTSKEAMDPKTNESVKNKKKSKKHKKASKDQPASK